MQANIIPNETLMAETKAAETPKQTPLQHGVVQLKTRLILACTAWNDNFGYRRGEELLTTLLVSSCWSTISERVSVDVVADADKLLEVMWKPISYFVNEIYTGRADTTGRTYAAVLTTGQYVYLEIKDNNFYQITDNPTEAVPATKIVMIRETAVEVDPSQAEEILEKSEFVRTRAPKPMAKARLVLKEQHDERHFKKKIDKRRAANKIAKSQKRKNRK